MMGNPDQATKDILKTAIHNHRNKHHILGKEDCEKWFFEIAYDAYAEVIISENKE